MKDNILKQIIETLLNNKAENVVYLNVSSFNPLAEYYVICSVSSNRQALALAKYVDDVLAKNGVFVKHIEGNSTSEWILVDGIDYIVHLFLPEARIKYSLEKLFCDVDIIKVD